MTEKKQLKYDTAYLKMALEKYNRGILLYLQISKGTIDEQTKSEFTLFFT